MPPNIPHVVFTVTPSIMVGGHFYRFDTMGTSSIGILDTILYGAVATNSHHENSWEIIRRMMFYMEETYDHIPPLIGMCISIFAFLYKFSTFPARPY